MDRKARSRERVSRSYSALEADIHYENPDAKLVYPNQESAAWDIINHFVKGKVAVTLLALPQVGKTGVMLEVAYSMATSNNDKLFINPENVYIISGMNDLDWQVQTKKSLPNALNEKVLTRSDFNKLTNLNSLENALIIIDECHIAAEERQQMSRKLKHAGLDNPEILLDKNVRILQVSATPAHVLFNSERNWDNYHSVVRLQASHKYIGFEKFLAADRIMNTHDDDVDNILEIEQLIKQEYITPKYHIFRLGRGKKDKLNFESMIARNSDLGWISKVHNCECREDTDLLFDIPPVQHTFLLIKGFWRAGKRLNDKNLGILYEGPAGNPDVNVVAQSLAGRVCGNDKQTPGKGTTIVYCHKKSLEDYITWFNGNGKFNTYYQSRHLKTDGNGNIVVRSSYNGEAYSEHASDAIAHSTPFRTLDDVRNFLGDYFEKPIEFGEFYTIDGYELSTRLNTYYGKNKDELEASDRLTLEKYNSISIGMNISSTGKGQKYMVYPVYETEHSREVQYYVRYLDSVYSISEFTFDTKESAKAWCNENLTYNSTFYNTYDANESEGTTHIKYRGKLRPLLAEAEARTSTLINIGANSAARIMPVTDIAWGVADTARIMPVTTPSIKYIVIYKNKFRIAKTEIPMLNG